MAKGMVSGSRRDRRDVRVRDLIRLRIVPIDPENAQAMLDRIALERLTENLDQPVYHSERFSREMAERSELPNTALTQRLNAIENKIDAVLMFLTQRDLEEKWGPPQTVNISAGGLLFPSAEMMQPDTLVRVEMLMKTAPPRPIVVLAKVVRMVPPDPEWGSDLPYRVALRFLDMDPDDRDRIVRRVFDVQRMFLRRSRQAAIDEDDSSAAVHRPGGVEGEIPE